MSINRLRVVITGASGGIGRALIRAMQPYIDLIILNGLDQQSLEQVRDELALKNCHIIAGDVLDPEVRQNIYTTAEAMGGINLLLNNAGMNDFDSFEHQSDEVITKLINVNLTAPMLLTKKLLPLLKDNPSQIINTGSIFGYLGFPGFVGYCSSKFGLKGFAQSLRRELSDTSVSVRYFAPRATRTPFNNSRVEQLNTATHTAMDSPEQVAQAFIKFLFKTSWQKRLGFKERFFTIVNDLFPAVTDRAIHQQLPIIKKYLSKKDL